MNLRLAGWCRLWRRAWRDKILPALLNFQPDIIFVCAGEGCYERVVTSFLQGFVFVRLQARLMCVPIP